jgi:hypothetical protein
MMRGLPGGSDFGPAIEFSRKMIETPDPHMAPFFISTSGWMAGRKNPFNLNLPGLPVLPGIAAHPGEAFSPWITRITARTVPLE